MNQPARSPFDLSVEEALRLLRSGRIDHAEQLVRNLWTSNPQKLEVALLLASVLLRQDRPNDARQILHPLLRVHTRNVELVGLHAVVCQRAGLFLEAAGSFETLIQLGQANHAVYSQLGASLLHAHLPEDAGRAFKKAVELEPRRADGYYNLGLALKAVGFSYETFLTFKRAIELDPAMYDAYVQLWNQMRQLETWAEGMPVLERGLKRFPDSTQMQVMLATAYGKIGLLAEAESLFKAAGEEDTAALLPFARWLQEVNRFSESVPLLKRSLAVAESTPQVLFNLANARSFELPGEPFDKQVLDHLERAASGEDQMFLHYALAKWFDASKNYERAFNHYRLANQIAYDLYIQPLGIRPSDFGADLPLLRAIYTPETILNLVASSRQKSEAIFIVGMIRTGTTLLDQILASHPKIYSVGEQPFWQISSGRFNRKLHQGAHPQDPTEMADAYLLSLPRQPKEGQIALDKMPTNFHHVGLIAGCLPNARFIHTRRNPLDTAVSIYTTFLGNSTQFAYSQENIVAFYRSYLETMQHWRSVLPTDRMIEIDYEDLVSDTEAVVRRTLEFLELPWDPACLHHGNQQGFVSTPSVFTARQPVNTASIERWRNYQPWLGALRELETVSGSQ